MSGKQSLNKGSIAWFARNPVAANLLMALVVLGGITTLPGVKQEVFPEFSLDLIAISVPYLGAAPEEVEEAVCIRIEEAIQGLDDIKEISSTAAEGVGTVLVELELGSDIRKVVEEIKSRVDAIDTFPEETEKPVIQELTNRRQVVDVAVAGNVGEHVLRSIASRVRDEIAALPEVTLAEMSSVRPYEISIEISEDDLRRHGLTFDFVAQAVRRSSLDLPGGTVRAEGGQILLRTKGQAYTGRDFEKLVLLSGADGSRLTLGEVATVVDGFAETDQQARFEGEPAAVVQVFRTGEQSALHISSAVRAYIEEARTRMPEGITLKVWQDSALVLRSRLDLMVKNAVAGFVLVFITLTLFLRLRLAFWVSAGLAMSFLGAIWLMPVLGVSVNLISLFAFILVLGIVVDDAIVVGENIHTRQRQVGDGPRGAVEGAREVSRPVVFAVLTTVAAFLPLVAVEGTTGKVMGVIPLIVIPCLLWSLVESLWILPAHLSHAPRVDPEAQRASRNPLVRFQRLFSDGLQRFVRKVYSPFLERALEWRYLSLAAGVAVLLITLGAVSGNYIRFIFFPDVEADYVSAAVTLPPGAPVSQTREAVLALERSAEEVRRAIQREQGQDLFKHSLSVVGEQPFKRVQSQNGGGNQARETFSHLGEQTIELIGAENRTVASAEIAERWRDATGAIPDAMELDFTASLFAPGDDIDVQLTGPDIVSLKQAAESLKTRLQEFAGVFEISDSFQDGKREVKLAIKPEAETLGLTLADLGRQVRQAFYGEEAQRVQRGRDEVKVMVAYPEAERRSLTDLEQMRIRTPDGAEVPFSEVARVEAGRGYSTIRRVNRRRAINVTADVDSNLSTPSDIIAELEARVLPEIRAAYPGIAYTFEGQQAEQRETLGALVNGFMLALVTIYALLAVPLKSYVQPLIIMAAIPFGLVGAIWGHFILGMDLTILSMFGIVALAGVVVNDSLVMVDFINRRRQEHETVERAVREAGKARFRPILLTSLTTFVGLFPLMLEKSMQARFLIPMAASLAFGVVFATFITLVMVPAAYLVLEDLRRLFRRLPSRRAGAAAPGVSPGSYAGGESPPGRA